MTSGDIAQDALWHVSEDGGIGRFEPRSVAHHDSQEPLVWAIDDAHVPAYWFPRDVPRGAFWATDETSDADVTRFLDGMRDRRVHAVQRDWLPQLAAARLFAYRLPAATFERYDDRAGYWVSRVAVEPLEVVGLADLAARHESAGIELRPVDDLWSLWLEVITSSLAFSGIRLRNLGGEAERHFATAGR